MLALAGTLAALAGPFPIREVSIAGASRVDSARVREAAGLAGANVFLASARVAESRVAAIPAVRRSRVTIQLPDRAIVEVEERAPAIVLTSSGGSVFADDEGVLFAAGADAPGLAVLEDQMARRAAGDRVDPALVAATRAIAAREPAYFGRAIAHIRLTPALGLVAVLEGGTEIRLGASATAQQIELKLEAARQIVLARVGKRLDYVDVRNRDNPVFFPRD